MHNIMPDIYPIAQVLYIKKNEKKYTKFTCTDTNN